MRPLRFLCVLGFFILLPIILTCISLLGSNALTRTSPDGHVVRKPGRLRSLFSFSTPSSLFPPSALITLTDDNSTTFYARPAAFGPSLPASGLSGQLWVGKGFGGDMVRPGEEQKFSSFELGCSDVPGWSADFRKRPENGVVDEQSANLANDDHVKKTISKSRTTASKRDGLLLDKAGDVVSTDDGTDDYLHHPLPDSNPAPFEEPGEPASVGKQDRTRHPTHADIESLQESADIAGKVVMLSRGGCGFLEKVKWAQRRGSIAVIVGDNEPGNQLIIMYARGDTSNITIPAIFTSYYSAHLLSTLVPSEEKIEMGSDGKPTQAGKDNMSKDRPNDRNSQSKEPSRIKNDKSDVAADTKADKGWVQNVLSVVGLEDDATTHGEDSRRPPGSGNIDWVLLEDWDEDKPVLTSSTGVQAHKITRTTTASHRTLKAQSTSMKKSGSGDDDFIIGVQDWRDTELIAPKSTASAGSKHQNGKAESSSSKISLATSSSNPTATALRGGSITPGSGEYAHQKGDASNGKLGGSHRSRILSRPDGGHEDSLGAKIASFFGHGSDGDGGHHRHGERPSAYGHNAGTRTFDETSPHQDKGHHGLWVTLAPTSPSTSPFFDTLLVLVVSPLITLTFVYGLLLLRSRIRRRRWRAPKSIVERLPVRTYHTMAVTSSSTSSSVAPPPPSSPRQQPSAHGSPVLEPTAHHRSRPRSQAAAGAASPSPTEKATTKSRSKRKRYTGRQVECVVCLEEYVDGESKVMSLPCGHEFHVECITPWLVTRRRTCPICKGDVVRSMARAAAADALAAPDDGRRQDEQTSNDVQERAATTVNPEGSAAIPIPIVEDSNMDNDIEQGSNVETPLLGSTARAHQGRWRGILGASLSRLSGDTVWRASVSDRNR